MLQIVFSDSECGSLKLATHWGPSSWDDGPIGFIFGDGEREPTQEEKDQAMAQLKAQWEAENRRARPVGGDPGDVLCPSVGLDIGPISGPDVEKARFDLLTAWLGWRFPTPRLRPGRLCPARYALGTTPAGQRAAFGGWKTRRGCANLVQQRTLLPVWVL